MSSVNSQLTDMIKRVAIALGDDLLQRVAFIGGCTTCLLITDEFSKEEVRFTDDVDLIIDVLGYAKWVEFQGQLKSKGFHVSMEDDVSCRMRLGELKVDFMPIDEKILGFSNRWYAKSLETAKDYLLDDNLTIKLLASPYFIATKLEAYLGRGNNDPLGSHDLEDILILIDGREELVDEIKAADEDVRLYIAEQFAALLQHEYFDHAVQGFTRSNKEREDLIYKRLQIIRDVD
ncbi:hypothetical protein COB64_00800 [Candidatus Wolfebacteria bacterium]|nr:MAG: hypothetical protein COB64_00800 [Candidatus Wolfebacteria bacterium]